MSSGQVTFGGLTMGAGTVYSLQDIRGLSPTKPKIDVDEKPDGDGAWIHSLADVEHREIVITGTIKAPTGLATARATLDAAFAPDTTESPFTWDLDGWDGEQSVMCLPMGVDYPITLEQKSGVIRFTAMLIAGDPAVSGESS